MALCQTEAKSLKAQVQITVLQHETDKRYEGEAQVSIPTHDIKSTFSFEMVEPNNVRDYIIVIKKNGKEVLRNSGNLPLHIQVSSYSNNQCALFILLYPIIVDGVKEAQRSYGGTTAKKSVRERVEEAIKFMGKEPVATVSFTREFIWKDKDGFDSLCKYLILR